MSFSAELKDFTNAFTAGMKLGQGVIDSETKNKLSEAHAKYYEAMAERAPAESEAKLAYMRSQTAHMDATTGAIPANIAYTEAQTKKLSEPDAATNVARGAWNTGGLGALRNSSTGGAPKQLPSFVQGTINDVAQSSGEDPGYLAKLVRFESRGNPNAVSPTGATGLTQFTRGTAAQYGLTNRRDPYANVSAAAALTQDNRAGLAPFLGRDPTHGELYLAHNQGLGGARTILGMDPRTPIGALPVPLQRNLRVNGARPGDTVGAFKTRLLGKFDRADAGDVAIPDDLEDQTMYAARGGLVQHFAEGGLVDDSPYDNLDKSLDTDPSAQQNAVLQPPDPTALNPEIFPVVDDYLRRHNMHAGSSAVPDPVAQREGYARISHPDSKASPQDVQKLHQTVDPLGKLDMHMRQIASFNALYNHYQNKGDRRKAEDMVGGLWMATQDAIREAGAYAVEHGHRGDIQGAIKAIQQGYNLTPDGQTLEAQPTANGAQFQFKDAEGNVTQEGKASIDDILKLGAGMANGSAFLSQWNLLSNKTAAQTVAEQRADKLSAYHAAAGASAEPGMTGQFLQEMTPEERKAYDNLDARDKVKEQDRWYKEFHGEMQRNRWQVPKGGAATVRKHRDLMNEVSGLLQNAAIESPISGAPLGTADAEGIESKEDKNRFDARAKLESLRQGDERLEMARQRLATVKNDRERAILEQSLGLPGLTTSKPTSKEGANSRAEQGIDTRTRAAITGVANAPLPADPAEMTDAERQGIYADRQTRSSYEVAGSAFDKKVREKGRDFDPNVTKEAEDYIVDNLKKDKEIPERQKLLIANIATNTYRANDMDHKLSTSMIIDAVKSKQEPRVLPDGTVQLNPDIPPVKMSRDSLLMLATLRGNKTSQPRAESSSYQGLSPEERRHQSISGTDRNNNTTLTGEQGLPTRRRGTFDAASDAVLGAIGGVAKSVLRAPIVAVQDAVAAPGEAQRALEAETKRLGLYKPGMRPYEMSRALMNARRRNSAIPIGD